MKKHLRRIVTVCAAVTAAALTAGGFVGRHDGCQNAARRAHSIYRRRGRNVFV